MSVCTANILYVCKKKDTKVNEKEIGWVFFWSNSNFSLTETILRRSKQNFPKIVLICTYLCKLNGKISAVRFLLSCVIWNRESGKECAVFQSWTFHFLSYTSEYLFSLQRYRFQLGLVK